MASSPQPSGPPALGNTPVQPWDVVFQDLTEMLADGHPEEQLRSKIRQWCEEARRRQLAPEQFLVVIKSQIVRVPGMRRMARDADARKATLDRVVTMCIEEYFGAD